MTFNFISFFPRAVMQGIPLLFGSTGEILTEKSGNLNLGIPGIMYVGGISGVIGAFFYEQSASGALNPFLAVLIPILSSLLGSLLMGLLYCFLTVTLRANQNVTGLAMTTFGVGVGNFFGGSLIKLTGSNVPSIALTNTSICFKTTLPGATTTGWFGELFLSYGFLAYAAVYGEMDRRGTWTVPACIYAPWARALPPPTPPASMSPSISTWPPASVP